MRVLHCSDVHLTHDYRTIPWRKLGWRRWLALLELGPGGRARTFADAGATLRGIASDMERVGADHLILSGDLTAYALEPEFRAAREALGAVADDPARCSVIPGNHDTYTPGAVRSMRFERHFGHLLASDVEGSAREGAYPFVKLVGEDLAVVGLLSARVPRFPGFAFGWIGARQLAALRTLVNAPELAGRAVLVAVHHAPMTPRGVPDRRLHGLRDAEALLGCLRGPRFAVLHGHIHHRHHHASDGVLPHIIGAGSSTQRGREGYWLIDVADGIVKDVRAMEPPRSIDTGRGARDVLRSASRSMRDEAASPQSAIRVEICKEAPDLLEDCLPSWREGPKNDAPNGGEDGDDATRLAWAYPPDYCVVAWSGEEPIGYVGVFERDGRIGGRPARLGGIAGLVTKPAWRHRGIATETLRAAVRELSRPSGPEVALLFAHEGRVAWFEHLGWRPPAQPPLFRQPPDLTVVADAPTLVLPLRGDPLPEGRIDLCGLPW